MRIAFNPSTVAALTTPPNNKDITFDLKGRNIFARGVKFQGTDTNTWRQIKINNVSIGTNILDLRNGSNTTLTNKDGIVTINSTWRPVVDNLTSDSTTSSLSANQGRVLKALIDGKSDSGHNHDGRYVRYYAVTTLDCNNLAAGLTAARVSATNAAHTNNSVYLYISDIGTPFQIQIPDSNVPYIYKRYYSSGKWSGWFKLNAGYADSAGSVAWANITGKPSSYTPSAHTHAWNSLTHSSTTENQAILTNGKANGWKLYTLNISGWNNAANNAHSHSNKSVLDGITSGLVNNWNTAYTFVHTITGTDTDKVINKWDEIVNFLAGIDSNNKLNTLLNSKLSIQQLAANDILTTKTNNALFWVNTVGTAGNIPTGPFTDHPYALLSVTNYSQNDTNSKFFYRSRLAFSSIGDIKVASCHHQNEYKQDETWYNVLTSKNSGISGSTIKLNGTSITVYSSDTADGRYVKKSGDTMTGVLTIDTTNFGTLTIKRNDDANGASIQFRGKSSVYGYIGLNNSTKDKQFLRWNSDTSKVYTILDTSSTYTSSGKGVINGTTITQVDNATNATNSTNARKLVNWYSARPTSLNTQFGDGSLRVFYATSSTTEGKSPDDATVLHLAWDNNGGWDSQLAIGHSSLDRVYLRSQNNGTWGSWKTLAFANEIPTSLKNPHALTISLNGTSQGPYDGSAAKSINITPSSIGAATSGHNHDGRYVYNYGGTKMDGSSRNKNALGMSTTSGISGDWWHILQAAWNDEYRWNSQIAFPTQNRNGMYYRSGLDDNTKWGAWIKLLDTGNSSISGNTITINGSSLTVSKSDHNHDYLVVNGADEKSFNSAYHNFQVLYAGGSNGITGRPANVDAFGLLRFRVAGGWSGQMLLANGGSLYIRSSEDAKMTNTLAWKTILDSSNYSGILDSRYYTESEINTKLAKKLDRVNLTTGNWNPRGYSLAADYNYSGGDISLSVNGGQMHVSVDGKFWQNEGQYRVLDTSDITSIRGGLTIYQYLSSTDNNWFPLVWGGSDHKNTNNSTGSLYKSHDKLSWQTSSQTLYATNIRTENIKNLSIGGGIYWSPYVESATDGSDAASITVAKAGVAGGTTLVLSQQNDSNDTIQFKTSTAARLYHNSNQILTSGDTKVSSGKGYINNTEITQVNNSDTLDGWHKDNIQGTGYITSSNSLTSYWFKMYDITVTGYQYNDITITFLVSEGYTAHFSIFYLKIRQNGTNNSGNYNLGVTLRELVGNLRDKVVAYYNNSTGNVQLWGNTDGQWGTMNYTIIKKTTRTATDSSSLGTLTAQGFSSVQTPPSTGYTKLTMSRVGSVSYSDSTGSVHWNNVTNKPSTFNPAAHTHTWASITDKIVAGNEFNIVNAGFKESMWFNYLPINDRNKTAAVASYIMGNGAKGYASVQASGFIKHGSNSSYVLLGDGGHKAESSLNVANADTTDGVHITWSGTNDNPTYLASWDDNGKAIRAATRSNITVGNADKLDGYHENSFLRYRGATSKDQEATLWSQIGIKQYNNALPDNLTGVYNCGSVISLPGSSSRFEIYASHKASNSNGLYYRSGWGDDKQPWRKFIDSANIGSQSVNYANSAGSASTLGGTSLGGLFTAFGNNAHNITATIGGVTKSFLVNWAADSDKLDGKHASDFATAGHNHDSRYVKIWGNVEANFNFPDGEGHSGVYMCHTTETQSNKPEKYGLLTDFSTVNGHLQFFGASSNKIYARTYWWTGQTNFKYTDWHTLLHTGNSSVNGKTITINGTSTTWSNTWRPISDDYEKGDASTSLSTLGSLTLYNDLLGSIPNPTSYYWANIKVSSSSSTTTSPTVNVLTATRVCAGHDPGISNSISCSNWFRSSGETGWYSSTYGGGWYMSDKDWIRSWGSKALYINNSIRSTNYQVMYGSTSASAARLESTTTLVYGTDTSSNSINSYLRGTNVTLQVKKGTSPNYNALQLTSDRINCNNYCDMKYGAAVSGGNLTVNNNSYLAQKANTKVGIGTSDPQYMLDVNGSARIKNLHLKASNMEFYLQPVCVEFVRYVDRESRVRSMHSVRVGKIKRGYRIWLSISYSALDSAVFLSECDNTTVTATIVTDNPMEISVTCPATSTWSGDFSFIVVGFPS